MRLSFLGTGAANGYPEAFCSCSNCTRARRLGGPSLRKRAALLVEDDLLIDLGPDITAASQAHGSALTRVRWCLQTHAHADHLDLSHLLSRSPAYGVVGAPRLGFYASPTALRRAAETFARDLGSADLLDPRTGDRLNLEVVPIEALQTVCLGPYRVTALPANHDPRAGLLLFLVEGVGGSLFYGTDTAPLPDATWRALQETGVQLDVVVLDHTYGPDAAGDDHLNARGVTEHTRRLREEGLLRPGGRVFATHIAHDANPPHPELVEFARGHGYDVAYDGLIVVVRSSVDRGR
ncbi:MAG: MBL fold metallo-hydrolase [Candidatus Bipolaricaulota bacterium]